jgi:hypothetical protein
MVNAIYAIYFTIIGFFSISFAFFWTKWIFENNPLIPPSKERRGLQIFAVFALFTSCWCMTYSKTQEDLGIVPKAPELGKFSLSTYAACCIFSSAFLLVWDCFCRGRSCNGQPPQLVPTIPAVGAIASGSCLVVPGLTILAVYESTNATNYYLHQEYIDGLFLKGVVSILVGSMIIVSAVFLWFRTRMVAADDTSNTVGNEEEDLEL